MCDEYSLLDHIWLLPILFGAALGVFLFTLKMVDTVRSVRKDSSLRSSLVEPPGTSLAPEGQNNPVS
jgi:hypothetical protein